MKTRRIHKDFRKTLSGTMALMVMIGAMSGCSAGAQQGTPSNLSDDSAVQDESIHIMSDEMDVASADETFEFYFTWKGTDFYELVTKDGTHMLIDPTYYLTETTCYDITDQVNTEVEDIKGCDWILLSHTHIDHDNQIDEILNSYLDAKAVVPGNSAALFTTYYGITPSQNVIIPAYTKDTLTMDDFTITVFEGKHTFLRGANANGPTSYQKEVLTEDLTPSQIVEALKNNSGNENLLCYFVEFNDGPSVLFWNGDVTNDYRLLEYEGLNPDIMFYQQAACNVGGNKEDPDPTELCAFIENVNPQIALPNHCEHFEMDNLYNIGEQMSAVTNENGGRTDYLEPTVLQWYGVNRLEDGTLDIKKVDADAVPEEKAEILEMPEGAGLH